MAKCRRQRANGTCQRHMPTAHANGDLPTATSQRQRANGNVPTATCQRLCSKFPEEFPVQCHFKNVGCADLSNYVFVVFNEYCCDFYIGIRRFSNNVDVFTTHSHASRRHYLFLALSVPNSNFILRAIGFLHVHNWFMEFCSLFFDPCQARFKIGEKLKKILVCLAGYHSTRCRRVCAHSLSRVGGVDCENSFSLR